MMSLPSACVEIKPKSQASHSASLEKSCLLLFHVVPWGLPLASRSHTHTHRFNNPDTGEPQISPSVQIFHPAGDWP